MRKLFLALMALPLAVLGSPVQIINNAVFQNAGTPLTGLVMANGTSPATTATTGNLTEATSAVLTITGGSGAILGSGATIQVKQASTSQAGYLSSTDWNTFNGKQSTLTLGNLTETTSSVLTITGGTGAVVGSGLTIAVKTASTSQSGYLTNTDWNTFNGKQASGNYLTALSGDGTATGPGSAALTLATVNANTGAFGSATASGTFTVNGKGLITAAASVTVTPAIGSITGLGTGVGTLLTGASSGTGGPAGTVSPTLTGTLTLGDATTPALSLAAGKTNTGTITINGKTSGSTKFTTADATAQAVTITTAAQTIGASTLTIPDQANGNRSFVFDTLTQTLTNKTISGASNTITVGFDGLLGATNSTATMHVGTGASLDATGSGSITATAAPVAGLTGAGSGILTWIATPSSANLRSALTDSTGTGSNVFGTNPSLAGFTLTGSSIITQAAMASAPTVDVTLPWTTRSLAAGETLAYSNATPTTGTNFYITYTADSTNRTITFPASLYSYDSSTVVASTVITASTSKTMRFVKEATRWTVYGDGVPVTGTGSFVLSTGPQISTIELGNASDTTLARASAGVMSVEGVTVDTISATNTLTNKRVTPRITSIASNATPTVNTDNCDCVTITALAAAITSMTTNLTGTPSNFDQLEFRILDNGTARAITWGASFASGTGTLPTTTILGKALSVYLEWDSVQAKWMCQSTGSYP